MRTGEPATTASATPCTAFSTFAVPTILGELRRHFRDKTWSVHVPRRAKELYQAISGVVDELTQVLGRSPTVPEIADRAGITVEDALEALEVRDMYRSETLDASLDDETREPAVLGQEDHGFAATDARPFIITMLIIGVIAGYLARLLVPGPDPMSVAATIVLGGRSG